MITLKHFITKYPQYGSVASSAAASLDESANIRSGVLHYKEEDLRRACAVRAASEHRNTCPAWLHGQDIETRGPRSLLAYRQNIETRG